MRSVYTVRQVNAYIKNMFTQDFMLNRIYVRGEVSNCKYHTSGHIYFSLKDESGTIACVMFAGSRSGLSFRMQERQVVETVYRRLYTPLGLRTLSPDDPEFHPCYGGEMLKRDLAYHQGTVWTFPLGGYYLAYLKVHNYSEEAQERVRVQLDGITAALREGCIGQLPEIYDGGRPVSSRGCFAQAWSVGEILRVYEWLC